MARYIRKGKYYGKTIEDVLQKDPNYLLWALDKNIHDIVGQLSQSEIKYLKDYEANKQSSFKGDDKTQLQVTCKASVDTKTNEPVSVFTIYGMDANEINAIKNALDKNPQKHTLNAIGKNNALLIRILTNDLDNWYQTGLKTIQSILIKSGNYDNDEVMHLEDEIYAKSGNAVSKDTKMKEYKDSKVKAIEIWKDYVSRLNDPEVRKIIEMYSVLPTHKEYGHLLSAKNAMLIRSVNTDATFILPISGWRALNRGVKKGAKRYVIYIPKGSEQEKQEVKSVIKKMGWGNIPYDELPEQVKRKVDIETNGMSAKLFMPVYEYDYSDTYLFKGQEDIFNNTIGLRNNLTGELNAHAKADAAKSSNMTPDELMVKRTKAANNYMMEVCQEKGIKYNQNPNPSINLVNMLEAKYKKDAMKMDILRDTNINKFAENATHITLLMGKLAYDTLNMFSHGYEYTNKEVGEMINFVGRTISDINANIKMNESRFKLNENNFVNSFMKAFKNIGCTIKNENDNFEENKQFNESRLDEIIKESIHNTLKKKH